MRARFHVQEAAWKSPARFHRIAEAFAKKPNKSLKKSKVKRQMAGYISALSHAMGSPLTEPEIRLVFDHLAGLKGKLRDTDIPELPDSFAKAIRREREGWPSMTKPDK